MITFILYILSFIMVLISCLFKFYKVSDSVYDNIVICVLLIHCFIEVYNHIPQSSESFIGMPDTSRFIDVMLVGSVNSMYVKNGTWDKLKAQMSKNLQFQFTFYDTDILDHEYISVLTNMDIQRLQHTPAILIQTPGGLFFYDDNIYDLTKIQHILLELLYHINLGNNIKSNLSPEFH